MLDIHKFIAKVRETDIIVAAPRRNRALSVRTSKNMWLRICVSLHQHQIVNFLKNLTFHLPVYAEFCKKKLDMTPYKVQLVQELKPHDH